MSNDLATRHESVVVCLPESRHLEHLGALPPNVELLLVPAELVPAELVPAELVPAELVPAEPGPVPDLSRVDLIVPTMRVREALFELLAGPPGRLRVIQTLSAGVDWLAGHVPAHVMVCNARGVYDGPLAEWVVGAILAMQRGLVRARDAQARGEWTSDEPDELAGRTVVILGMGSIGTAIADRLRPFGVEIVGVARTRRDGLLGLGVEIVGVARTRRDGLLGLGVARTRRDGFLGIDVVGLGDLDAVLPRADILVNMLPLTSETGGLLDARRLALLPDGALLVNGGRGRTVDTEALVREATAGRLRAALDVTDPEPLPAGHALWSLPNVLISPHIAGDSPDATRRAFELAGDQIRRFAAGEPLLNEVPRYQLE